MANLISLLFVLLVLKDYNMTLQVPINPEVEIKELPTTLPDIDPGLEAFGSTGEGIIYAARAIKGGSDRAAEVYLAEKLEDNKQLAIDQENKFISEYNEIVYGKAPDEITGTKAVVGYYEKNERDAVDSYPDTLSKVNTAEKTYRRLLLNNPQALRLYNKGIRSTINNSRVNLAKHFLTEKKKWQIANIETRQALATITAVKSGGEDDAGLFSINTQKEKIITGVIDKMRLKGYSKDTEEGKRYYDVEIVTELDAFFSSIITGKIRGEYPDEALNLLNLYEKDISKKTSGELLKLLKEPLLIDKRQKAVAAALDHQKEGKLSQEETKKWVKRNYKGKVQDETIRYLKQEWDDQATAEVKRVADLETSVRKKLLDPTKDITYDKWRKTNPDDFSSLNVDAHERLKKIAAAKITGKNHLTVSDGKTYNELTIRSAKGNLMTKEAIMGIDLENYKQKLTEPEFDEFIKLQKSFNLTDANQRAAMSDAMKNLEETYPSIFGVREKDQDEVLINSLRWPLRQWMQSQFDLNEIPNLTEIDKFIATIASETKIDIPFFQYGLDQYGRAIDIQDLSPEEKAIGTINVNHIPPAQKDVIRKIFLASRGSKPKPEEIGDYYFAFLVNDNERRDRIIKPLAIPSPATVVVPPRASIPISPKVAVAPDLEIPESEPEIEVVEETDLEMPEKDEFEPEQKEFNPEGGLFDSATAEAHGMIKDGKWDIDKFRNRVPTTPEQHSRYKGLPVDSFMILLGRDHPMWDNVIDDEKQRGYQVVPLQETETEPAGLQGPVRYFSIPLETPEEPVSQKKIEISESADDLARKMLPVSEADRKAIIKIAADQVFESGGDVPDDLGVTYGELSDDTQKLKGPPINTEGEIDIDKFYETHPPEAYLSFMTSDKSNELIKSIIFFESSNKPEAISNKNAIGLMQIKPSTAKNPGFKKYGVKPIDPEKLKDPVVNRKWGTIYFNALIQDFNNKYPNDKNEETIKKALASYNWGIGNVRKLIRKHGNKWWFGHLPNTKEKGDVQAYVNKIIKRWNKNTRMEIIK